jgi:hypothetical protein
MVSATMRSATEGSSFGMREGRVLSRRSPSTPSAAKRSCQRQTQVLDLPASRMLFVRPGTLGAQQYDLRQTRFCGALRSLTRARSRGDGNGNAGSHAADSHAARRPGIPSGFKYQTRSTSPCPFPWR